MTAGKSKPVVMPLRFLWDLGQRRRRLFMRASRCRVRKPASRQVPLTIRIFHGGHTIADLVFTNSYIGGTTAWKASDIENIDKDLSAAMWDVDLNNVMAAGSLCRTAKAKGAGHSHGGGKKKRG